MESWQEARPAHIRMVHQAYHLQVSVNLTESQPLKIALI